MHQKLRAFLEANGLRAGATEQEAWEHYRKMQADGVEYSGPERAEPDGATGAARSAAGARSGPGSGDDGADDGADGDGDAGDGNSRDDSGSAPPAAPPVDGDAIAAAVRAERQRCQEIEDACAVAGIDQARARQMIDRGVTIDEARAEIFEELRRRGAIGAGAGRTVGVGRESRDKLRDAIRDGLSLRAGMEVENPAAGAREFRSRALHEIARECLEHAGISTRGMSRLQVVGRALAAGSTSDFPQLMSGLVNRTMLAAYEEWPQTWRPFVAIGDANDFKDMHAIKMSEAPDLMDLDENGEYRTASFSDSGETYRVVTKGRTVALTRQMIVNDDLRAFTRIPRLFGAAARRMEADAVYSLITSNPTMSDGNAFFSSAHRNLGSGSALGSSGLAADRAAMRKQRGMSGATIDVTPAFLLVAVEQELDADILLRSAALPDDNKSSGVYNPWAGKLTPIADPHITSPNRYLLAHPNQFPAIEVAYLMGETQPFVDEELDFDSDALKIKVRHDFGAGLVDWIGAYMNPGA